jgi:hypothetical protein
VAVWSIKRVLDENEFAIDLEKAFGFFNEQGAALILQVFKS